MTDTANRLARAIAAFRAADQAWTDAYLAICPRGTWPGDFRYTDTAKGEPGSALRALHDAFRAAGEEHHAAWVAASKADAAVRANPDLVGKAAYDASLAAAPLYHDGTPRPAWEQLGKVERWTWERPVTSTPKEQTHAKKGSA